MVMGNDDIINEKLDDLSKKINLSKSRKIIVTGDKKSGKSEALKYYTQKSNNNSRCVVYIDYKDVLYKAALSNKEYDFYYELIFVKKMLESVKLLNDKIFSNFEFFEKIVNIELSKFREFLLTRFYSSDEKIKFKKHGLIKNMIKLFELSGIERVNLVIDHFDFVGESSERFQKFMEEYFSYFNKVIITSNEKMKDDKIKKLKNNGYFFVEVNNGKNREFIRRVLSNYLDNMEKNEIFDVNYILRIHNLYVMIVDDSFVDNLIDRCNGNIDMMMQVFRCYVIGEEMEESINSSVRLQAELDGLTYKRILHL